MMLSLYGHRPLLKRIHKKETMGIMAYLQRLPDEEFRKVYRRMAQQSESFARSLREMGQYEWIFPEEEEAECE